MNKAVFLDKDGTINKDVGYLNNPTDLELIPGSAEAIKKLKDAGYKIIVVSNQAGVARGLLSENTIKELNRKLNRLILNAGTSIDEIYYCPHHPEYGEYPFKKECDCRKPNPGMLIKAAKKHDIDMSASYMVGDKQSDIEAGQKVGTKTILVRTGYGEETAKKEDLNPDHIAKNLADAVKWILENEKIQSPKSK